MNIKIKKICLLIISIILLVILALNIWSVHVTNEKIGFAYLEDNGETVYFYSWCSVKNTSFFPRIVTLETLSYADAESKLISDPKLEIVSLEWTETGEKIIGDTFIIEPFSTQHICIQSKGKYGGNGNGERHPADTIKVADNRMSGGMYSMKRVDAPWQSELEKATYLNEKYILPYLNDLNGSDEVRKLALEASKQKLVILQTALQSESYVYNQYKEDLCDAFNELYMLDEKQENASADIWGCAGEGSLHVGVDEMPKYSYFLRLSDNGNVWVQCLQYGGAQHYSECFFIEKEEEIYLILVGNKMSQKAVEIWQKQDQLFIPVEIKRDYADLIEGVEYEGVDDGMGGYSVGDLNSRGTDLYSLNNTVLFAPNMEILYDESENNLVIKGTDQNLTFVFRGNEVQLVPDFDFGLKGEAVYGVHPGMSLESVLEKMNRPGLL